MKKGLDKTLYILKTKKMIKRKIQNVQVNESLGELSLKNYLILTGTKELLNQKVIYKNPKYIELDFATIGNKFNKGIIKDYDGDYLIIENLITHQEEYINRKEVKFLK